MNSLVQAIKKKIFNRLIIMCLIVANSSAAGAQNGSLQVFDQKGKELWLYKESHALVIWAGDYQHWSKLNNIKDEVQELKEVLQMHRFVVKTLDNPDGKQLRQSIQDFLNNFGYQSDNRLVIFFAGHGWTRKNSKGYLVPVDAPDPAVSRKNEHEFLKIALDMEQFESWAKQIEAKHVLFVFDSCFSGLIFKKRSATDMPLYIESIKNKPVRQFLAAGDADQRVPAKSYFTPLFIRALQGEADIMKDGYVTGSELGLYLKQNLTVYTKEQTPQFGTIRDPGLDQGDIVFRVSQSKPSVAMRPSRPSYSPAMLEESISIARPTPRSGQRIRKEDPYAFGQEKVDESESISVTLNSMNPQMASALANLATLYEAQGKYAKAEETWKKVLQVRARDLGENHPDYADSLQSIAALYLQTGRVNEAEAFQITAVSVLESAYGKDHPRTASSLNSLASIYLRLANYKTAAPLIERALRIRSASLGPDPPDLVPSLQNLIVIYQKAGDLPNAERVRIQMNSLRQSSRTQESNLGDSLEPKRQPSPSGLIIRQGDIR